MKASSEYSLMLWIAIPLVLAAMCFASFSWAILKLFKRRSSRVPAAMRALGLTGFLFFIAHITALAMRSEDGAGVVYSFGILFYCAALALFWKSANDIRKQSFHIAFTDHQPEVLVMNGAYKYIRHPFYASYLLFWIAGVLCSESWWLLTSVFVMGAFYFAAILHEEREFLASEMSEDYLAYIRRTGRLMPKLQQFEKHSD